MAAPRMMTLDFRREMSRWKNSGPWLLTVGLCAAIAVGLAFVEANRQLLQFKRDANRMLQSAAPPTAAQSDSDRAQLASEISHAAEIIRQLSLAWDPLFLAVQPAAKEQVALLSIQPDTAKQLVRITGEARDMDAMLEYITRLRRQQELAQVILNSHEIKEQNPDKPVYFSMSAQWMIAR